MSQIKIYGLKEHLDPIKARLSDVIHDCIVEAIGLPRDKRAHRFFGLEPDDFYRPATASPRYIILEINMITGRTSETKAALIHALYRRTGEELGLAPTDLEIQIIESPKANWGFRGMTGEEIALSYKIEV
ncbi:tautomerase family protein [bacterium]|nr:MAG: tautomerase family protein [bacterium]